MVYTVNAGAVPADHWTVRPDSGGGRLAGEGCHFLDLMRFLAGAPAVDRQIARMGDQSATVTLTFDDGPTGTLLYLANGHKGFPKERLEIFCDGRILQLDNFRVLRGFGWPGFRTMRLWRQDKGANACAAAFVDAVRRGAESPIPFAELIEVARLSLA
jgi:predicted dehydrogenase